MRKGVNPMDNHLQSNNGFICSICGAEDGPDAACSTLALTAGYGSVHDMECVRVPICGECCDKLFAELSKLCGAVIESIQ